MKKIKFRYWYGKKMIQVGALEMFTEIPNCLNNMTITDREKKIMSYLKHHRLCDFYRVDLDDGECNCEAREHLAQIDELYKKEFEKMIGKDEVLTAYFRRYNEAPKEVEDWLTKLVEPQTRNILRSELRSKLHPTGENKV